MGLQTRIEEALAKLSANADHSHGCQDCGATVYCYRGEHSEAWGAGRCTDCENPE